MREIQRQGLEKRYQTDYRTNLNIQTNEGLSDPKPNCHNNPFPYTKTCKFLPKHSTQIKCGSEVSASGKQVLQAGKERKVKCHTEKEARSTKFTSTTDNLKDLGFNFSLEGGVEFVPGRVLQMMMH